MATYCIICGKQRNGPEVKGDHVIGFLRWFKKNVTRDEKRNRLVVCKECYPAYKKRRDRYTSRQTLYMIIGAIFLVLGVAIAFSPLTLAVGLLMLAGLYLLSLMNYTPALSVKIDNKRIPRSTTNK